MERNAQSESRSDHHSYATKPRRTPTGPFSLCCSSTLFGQNADTTEIKQDRAELAQFEINNVIPSLQERHAALDAELMAERALDEELSSYNEDQREELAQLHADIEEQEQAFCLRLGSTLDTDSPCPHFTESKSMATARRVFPVLALNSNESNSNFRRIAMCSRLRRRRS